MTSLGGSHKLRAERLEEVLEGLDHVMRRKFKDDRTKAFICSSDLQRLWADRTLVDDILFDNPLTEEQFAFFSGELLPLFSFLVYIEPPESWYSSFTERVFGPGHSSRPCIPHFTLPLPSTAVLVQLGIRETTVNRNWEHQYLFIPITIDFDVAQGAQVEDRHLRMPLMAFAEERQLGGQGLVHFCRIPPENIKNNMSYSKQRWLPDKPYAVAVKTFRPDPDIRNEAREEVQNLCHLKSMLMMNQRHINVHHAIVEQGPDYHIIMPLADRGDLWQFLQAKEAVTDNGDDFERLPFSERFQRASQPGVDLASSLLKQCVALAEALVILHAGFATEGHDDGQVGPDFLFCAHLDLKPNNIIIFDDPRKQSVVGIWKLTDFGISVVRESTRAPPQVSRQQTLLTRMKRIAGDYSAPEIRRAQLNADEKIGRKSDVWSFACIFSEVLTFALGGAEYVRRFEDKRESGSRGRIRNAAFCSEAHGTQGTLSAASPTFVVRQEVTEWLEHLRENASGAGGYVDSWVACIERTLQVDTAQRPSAHELLKYVKHVRDDQAASRISGTSPYAFTGQTTREPGPTVENREDGVDGDEQNLPHTGSQEIDPLAILINPPTLPLRPNEIFDSGDSRQENPETSPLSSKADFLPFPLSPRWQLPPGTSGGDPQAYASVVSPVVSHVPSQDLHHRQESLTSSFDTGRPPNAYGIKCSADRERVAQPPEIWEPSPTVSGAAAVAMDRERLVFLVEQTVRVFAIQPHLSGEAMARHEALLQLPNESTYSWTGVAVAGDVVAAWGACRKTEKSLLYVARLRKEASGSVNPDVFKMPKHGYQTQFERFDHDKRVAVSRQGAVAIICDANIFVFKLGDPFLVYRFPETPLGKEDFPFNDIAFNEVGDMLWAWAVGNQGVHLAWRISALSDSRPDSIGRYDWDISEKEESTTLFPYNSYLGAIVAASEMKLFFPAIVRGSLFNDRRDLPRYTSDQLKVATVRAACMYNDHSLISLQRNRFRSGNGQRHYRVEEYPLQFGASVHRIGDRKELCQLSLKPKPGSCMSAFRYGDEVLILVVHINGKVESIKFTPTP